MLEVGTGSGYAAAILGRVAKDVYTLERLSSISATASERLARLGYANVHAACADGSLGWQEHAPYDAIAVAAGGPRVPKALLSQLAIGGRLVMPVGADESSQILVRVTRQSEMDFLEEPIADARFVPLIGEQGWGEDRAVRSSRARRELRANLPRLGRWRVRAPSSRPSRRALRDELTSPRLERAISVVYRTETELESHDFHASLARQFDEYVWFDETRAVEPLPPSPRRSAEQPRVQPFGS